MLTGHAVALTAICALLVLPMPATGSDSGDRIAFYSARSGRDDIFVMNADGSNVQLVTKGVHGGKCPDLSPDGKRIVFVSMRDGNSELYLLDLTTGTERRLTDLPSTERQPKWSPDGNRIVLQSNRDGNYEIYLMDADGTDWKRLTVTDSEELWPNWSPDGTRIAFSSAVDGNWEIYVINTDGSDLRRLTSSTVGEMGAAWSPDGTRLAFKSSPPQRFQGDIHVINIDGTNEIKLTDFDGVEENPVWSPDGSQIAFQTMKDGSFEIYVMKADGSDMRDLTNNPSHDYWPSWGRLAKSPTVASSPKAEIPMDAVELQILYDDVARADGMATGWGFSCLIKAGDKTLLMDASADGKALLSNMAACHIDPAEIDAVMISHCHADHIGGLPAVMSGLPAATKLYLPGNAVPGNLAGRALATIDSARSMAGDVSFIQAPEPVCAGVMSTGLPENAFPEQSFVILSETGPIVITGCAHPGIVQIVKEAAKLAGEPVLMVMGGFHLVAESQETLDRLAAELDGLVKYVAPCHCSGNLARECFQRRFGDHYLDLGAGSLLRVADLIAKSKN